MKSWSITEARANISGVFDVVLVSRPQRIERRDSEPVVMIAEFDWRRLVAEFESFADFVLNSPLEPENLPERRPADNREGAGVKVCSRYRCIFADESDVGARRARGRGLASLGPTK